MPHAAAAAHCESHGARLCAMVELPAARGTGCRFDKEPVWSATACTTAQGERGFLSLIARDDTQTCNVAASYPASVRCCADPRLIQGVNIAPAVSDSYEEPYEPPTDDGQLASAGGSATSSGLLASAGGSSLLFAAGGGAAVCCLMLASYALYRTRCSRDVKNTQPARQALPWHDATGARIQLHSVPVTPEPSIVHAEPTRHSSVKMPVGSVAPPPPPILPPMFRQESSFYKRLSLAEQRC